MGFQNYNHYIPNIVHISGALSTLGIPYEYAETQCEEGAKDVNNILDSVVI